MVEEIIKPDPDSQYRLVPCSCGCEPVYRKMGISAAPEPMWYVYCPKCMKNTALFKTRHDAQLCWNKMIKGVK